MRVLQINTTVNTGSTGRIAEELGKLIMETGHESFIAYGRGNRPSASKVIPIGSKWDVYAHGALTLLTDRHAFGSAAATRALMQRIEEIQPDRIVFHNLHGYYLNVRVLFQWLEKRNIPVLWVLHDCWAFTGHCAYFDDVNCEKWKTECHHCPKTKKYPSSRFLDNSRRNFKDKKSLFTSLPNLTLVAVSAWLKGLVGESFLKDVRCEHIHNGTDLQVFKPVSEAYANRIKHYPQLAGKTLVLGVASIWDDRKGLGEFIALRRILDDNITLVLIGLQDQQISLLPEGMLGIRRTENVQELAEWYSAAAVYANPTLQDNFPTTNIEALACGCPVVTYQTGGSPEALDENCGRVVPKGDRQGFAAAVQEMIHLGQAARQSARQRAEHCFDKETQLRKLLHLFEQNGHSE